MDWDDEPTKRTLTQTEKEILWERAGHKCECCGKEVDFIEMQAGHKIAWSKGGATTLKNSACLCFKCNRMQHTRNWKTYLKELGKIPDNSKLKDILNDLKMDKLKFLAKKYHIKVKGTVSEGFLENSITAPSKKKYVNALAEVVTEEMIDSALKEMPEPIKKKKRRSSSDSWF